MFGGISLSVRSTLGPELLMGDTRVLAESQAIVVRLPRWTFVWNRPLAVTAVRNGQGQRVQIHAQRTKGVQTMIGAMNGTAPASAEQQMQHHADEFFDRILAAAQPTAVFSAPVVSGEYTLITASDVFAAGGFGFGDGTEAAKAASGSGGGGGGASHSRPVAAVIVGPDGVEVKPIVDATRVALAVMGVLGAITFMAVRVAKLRAGR
jgi:uncharacterized spore protein YtfJ